MKRSKSKTNIHRVRAEVLKTQKTPSNNTHPAGNTGCGIKSWTKLEWTKERKRDRKKKGRGTERRRKT